VTLALGRAGTLPGPPQASGPSRLGRHFMTTLIRQTAFQLLTYLPCLVCFTIPLHCTNFVDNVHGHAVSNRALLYSFTNARFHTCSKYKMAAIDVTDATFKREVLGSDGDA
jgi:hypothetical protein